MTKRENAFARHQQARFLRPDAHRFVRPDVARYLQPGVDPADVFPALAQQSDRQRQAEVRQLKAEIAELAAMRDDLLAMKAEIARRCEATISSRKYSPSQPRVPRGNSDGGQWTSQSRSGGGGGGLFDGFVSGDSGGGDSSGSGALGFADPSSPMGNIDFGDLGGWNESDGLFGITPSETDNTDLVQVAGDVPGIPSDEPPEIPDEKPKTSAERTAILRSVASWLGRAGLSVSTAAAGGIINSADWFRDWYDLADAARDGPKTLDELHSFVGQKRPGYDDHHIVEQTWAEYFGFVRSQIDEPSNLVSIPRAVHWQITGWYGTKNESLNGLTPRQFLADKGWDERREIGLYALRTYGVLRP